MNTYEELSSRVWAEAGEWTRGEPAVVVMRGEYEDGQLIGSPDVLHDVPVSDWRDRDAVDAALAALGYRADWSAPGSTAYGIVLKVSVR